MLVTQQFSELPCLVREESLGEGSESFGGNGGVGQAQMDDVLVGESRTICSSSSVGTVSRFGGGPLAARCPVSGSSGSSDPWTIYQYVSLVLAEASYRYACLDGV